MKITVEYSKEGKRYSCYIKEFDIYFSATAENDIERRAKIIVEMWYNHHIHMAINGA
jgi:hypothetical protein